MKRLLCILLVTLIASAGAISIDAKTTKKSKGRRTTTTTTAKAPATAEPNVVSTTLADPARDEANPCNQGTEPLRDFLEKWASDPEYRLKRSKFLVLGNYFDGEINDWGAEERGTEVYESYLNQFQNKDWEDMLIPHQTTVTTGRDIERCQFEWSEVSADIAVYMLNWETEGPHDAGSGSGMQLTFQRKGGRWYLVCLCIAG